MYCFNILHVTAVSNSTNRIVSNVIRFLFLAVTLVILVACSPTDDEENVDATIDAQSTLIAELTLATSTSSNLSPTSPSVELATTTIPETPIPTTTSAVNTPISTPTERAITIPRLLWFINAKSWSISGKTVFLENLDGSIEAFFTDTGSLIWKSSATGTVLASDDRNVYVSSNSRRVDALDSRNGEIRWAALLSDEITFVPTDGAFNGLFIRTKGQYLWIDKETGNIIELGDWSSPTYTAEDIIVIKELDVIKGFSQNEGQFIWQRPVRSGDAIICTDIFVFINREDPVTSTLEALDYKTGAVIWEYEMPSALGTTLICPQANQGHFFNHLNFLLSDNSRFVERERNIYIAGGNKVLAAIHDQTGELHWIDNTILEFRWLGEVEDLLYYSHDDFGLTRAYDVETHQLVWENPTLVIQKVIGIADDTLVAALPNNSGASVYETYTGLVGLDPATGVERWRLEPDGIIETVAIVEGHLLYTLYDEATLRFLDPNTGVLLTSIESEIIPPPYNQLKYYGQEGFLLAISLGEGLIAVELPE